MSADCIFCKIIAGQISATKVYEDDLLVAFNDISPAAPVHVLLVPKQHISSANDLTEGDAGWLGRLFTVAKSIARERGIEHSGYRISTNTGPDSGQAVFHIHFHLIGGRHL